MLPQTRHITLDGIHNLRDLGGLSHSGGMLPRRRFWRSDSLHGLAADGVQHLLGLGLVTIIDLRQADEAASNPNPFQPLAGRVAYHNAPIFAGLDLNDPEIVDAEDPLFALYRRALAERSDRFAVIMRLIANAAQGGVLFHCTVGKDRTGMIAAMLLKLAGVADADIVADYVETTSNIGPVLAALRDRAVANNWDVARLSRYWRSDAATMERFLDHLDTSHGGVATYLKQSGLTADDVEILRARLASPDFSVLPHQDRPS